MQVKWSEQEEEEEEEEEDKTTRTSTNNNNNNTDEANKKSQGKVWFGWGESKIQTIVQGGSTSRITGFLIRPPTFRVRPLFGVQKYL